MQTESVIILAAGAGRRLGRVKAMATWGDGTLLDAAIIQARQLSRRVIVVAGAGYPLVRFRTRHTPDYWCYNPDWEQGQASSLQAGIASLPGGACGALVMLVDQPLIPLGHYQALLAAARAHPGHAVATQAGARIMAPAWLPAALFAEIAGLTGDQGARQILRKTAPQVVACDAALMDVDTPERLSAAKQACQPGNTG